MHGQVRCDRTGATAPARARLRRGRIGVLVWAATLALVGCGATDQQVWSGPQLPGPSGSLSGALPPGVDDRVVNGVAWVASGSAVDDRWLRHQIDVLEAQELSDCLNQNGLPPELLRATADERAVVSARVVSTEFPDPERVEDAGLWPRLDPDPERSWSPRVRSTVMACRQENPGSPSAQARAVGEALRVAFDELVESRPDPELTHAVSEFSRCLTDRGYPSGAVISPEVFVTWAFAHRGSDDPFGLEVGTDYVECGEPVWETSARARAAVRLAFVDDHESELRLLSDLVTGA